MRSGPKCSEHQQCGHQRARSGSFFLGLGSSLERSSKLGLDPNQLTLRSYEFGHRAVITARPPRPRRNRFGILQPGLVQQVNGPLSYSVSAPFIGDADPDDCLDQAAFVH